MGFWDLSEHVDLEVFAMGFGVWKGLQWIGMAVGFKWTDSQSISSNMNPDFRISEIPNRNSGLSEVGLPEILNTRKARCSDFRFPRISENPTIQKSGVPPQVKGLKPQRYSDESSDFMASI